MGCTNVSLPCVWQPVYLGSISSVLVGPTTSYSAVPATQNLSLSDTFSCESKNATRLTARCHGHGNQTLQLSMVKLQKYSMEG